MTSLYKLISYKVYDFHCKYPIFIYHLLVILPIKWPYQKDLLSNRIYYSNI